MTFNRKCDIIVNVVRKYLNMEKCHEKARS
nr:MAG TPA: hypothetical protein [Caudoviricetes sp.]